VSAGALAGRRVLVARAVGQAAELSDRIRAAGGEPIEAPVLRIEPGDTAALRAAMRDLAAGAYRWVGLTSPNGVDAVADALAAERLDARALAGADGVACVGSGTAARLFERLRVVPDLVPPRATTRSLGEALPVGTGRVLLPRADIANPSLPELLRAKGYEPEGVVAYRTGLPDDLDAEVVAMLAEGSIDLLPLASPSTARNLLALLAGRPWRGAVVSIGPVTSAVCRELGIPLVREADPHDLDGLLAALCDAAGDLPARA
jgi:uroporphyrinogen-III synthase